MKDLATSPFQKAESQEVDPMNFNTRLDKAICRSRDYLLSQQTENGFWVDKLESNATITAELIFFMYFTETVDLEKQEKLANYLLYKQRQDGNVLAASSVYLFLKVLRSLSVSQMNIEVPYALLPTNKLFLFEKKKVDMISPLITSLVFERSSSFSSSTLKW